ncbi:MAG: hypothetical protein RRY54_06280 [Angelakisella sp.]
MIEMVTKISQAEEAAGLIRKEAQQKAAQMEADAHKVGKAKLAELRAKHEAESAKAVEAAQAQSLQLGSENLESARNEAAILSQSATAKISRAASLIVERIVDSK